MSVTGHTRRALLRASFGLALASWLGCDRHSGAPALAPTPTPLPDRHVAQLTDLLTSASLRWLILIQPRVWFSNERLRPGLLAILQDDRLDALQLNTGIDLRQTPEVALASYPSTAADDGNGDDTIAYAVRHIHDRALLELRFRQRLSERPRRRVDGHQLAMIDGKVGVSSRALATIGPEVCVFQFDGKPARGPARLALLYASGRLSRVPAISAQPELSALLEALGDGPLRALLPGPFEGDLARGARGLMAAANAVGASLELATAPLVRLRVMLFGDYQQAPERALALLQAAWQELALSDLGHLLGLGQPATEPSFDHGPLGLQLVVQLDADALLQGLAAATTQDVRDIMRERP